ncbi:hypothetical protein A2567_00790 [Candidatus Azambacteria bacterium RIFOXYD1_FULL_42_11]|uniref:Uncharacterized protein n=3 Tax=Candidatus Azamiibacteriota TaxID=1752741 RepID=A0A0G0ZD21_9BACT|nr:MAG: hypothetical protein UV10_C0001G0062 [Candidatus Azambacteria bacterium GW2011_GWA1_42_19]KKS75799.1 MAG: hypothetical protein UV48_C0006G0013 [Candidatus Azambacteria bacterium GW2011_GWA2_42_9]KKS88911.1 MAG: hypothetical protein UV62_C0001G0053 [Parcubacteria group bacterium GW2011_GWC1_43_11]OGD41760.1 MAG: hypothetical protein A2567_00790 [Candidatus Azambacteria bacterium RIFOXYD1_FULL_42_11]
MKGPIYQNIISGTEPLYQKYFEEILDKIDVQNFTNQALGRSYDKDKIKNDYKIVEQIVNMAKEKSHLSPLALQVMLEQYLWADVYMREMDKDKWIYRVINRKDEDFFPDSMVIYKKFFEDKQ